MSNTGALMARVFEDENSNGIYDNGELLIEGVKVKGIQNHKVGVSDHKGMALIPGMTSNIKTDVKIDEASLPDAFMVPLLEGSSITPREGYLEYLDFPVVVSNELDGTIYIKAKDGTEKPAPFIKLNLINEAGEIAAQTTSEYDGYYYFSGLLPGEYKVSIDQADLSRKQVANKDDIKLMLGQGNIIDGANITLSELEFTEGYAVKTNTFNNLKMLKNIWLLIKNRIERLSKAKVFYIKDQNNQKYNLFLGFYQSKLEANQACSKMDEIKIACSVEAFEFGF